MILTPMPEYYTIVHVHVENNDENAKRIRCCATKHGYYCNTNSIFIRIFSKQNVLNIYCTKIHNFSNKGEVDVEWAALIYCLQTYCTYDKTQFIE